MMPMMNGDMQCGALMMAGMGLLALLLVGTLALTAAAAVKYLRSGPPAGADRTLARDNSDGL